MTTVMDWVRAVFGTKSATHTVAEERLEDKVEKKPKALDLKSLEEQVEKMQMSGCGCYRYPARDLFAQYHNSGCTPEEMVQVYAALRGKLHSSCRGRSYTSSNIGTVRGALEACYKVLEQALPETRGELIKMLEVMKYDLDSDGYEYSVLYKDSDVQQLMTIAARYMSEEDGTRAMELLRVARGMAKKTEQANVATEMVSGLMKSYRPKVIHGLAHKSGGSLSDLSRLVADMPYGDLQTKMVKRLRTIEHARSAYEDTLPELVEGYYDRKIRPLEQEVRNVEQRYQQRGTDLAKEKSGELKKYDQAIQYQTKAKLGTTDDSLRGELNRLLDAKVQEKEGYVGTMTVKEQALAAEKAEALRPLQEEMATLHNTSDRALEHYRAGTMTRVEYAGVDRALREEKRKPKE